MRRRSGRKASRWCIRRGERQEEHRDHAADAHHGSWATHADPKTQARRARCDLIYLHEVDKRGHLAAREQPNSLRPSSVLRSVQLKVWVTFVNPNS
jgi:hypothetical protein